MLYSLMFYIRKIKFSKIYLYLTIFNDQIKIIRVGKIQKNDCLLIRLSF